MTDDKRNGSVPQEYDPASDPLTPLIADALADLVLPPLDDTVDLPTAAEALTDEDRKAMAALGTSEELVARIVAAAEEKSGPSPQAAMATELVAQSTENTRITGPGQSPECTLDFGELLQRLRDCERQESLSWSSDYRKREIIGSGGQGTVYLTECLNEHNLPKAMKVFSPLPYGNVRSYYEDMERMAHVASLVYSIQVDNLVIIERFAYHDGICLMIMRWIDGHDLAKLLQPKLLEQVHGCVDKDRWNYLNDVVVTASGTCQLGLKPAMAVNIIEKCLRALDALHSNKIVHGDIKPSNIMLDRYGSIRLVDIGSASELSAPPRRRTWTPRYAPPEIFEGGKWTPKSDLASLGYVLIELLSGQPIITDPTIPTASMHSSADVGNRKLSEMKRQLPGRLYQLLPPAVQESQHLMNICRRLIDPDPGNRFASAEEALEGSEGTYQFQQSVARGGLSVCYSQEIKRWLTDVQTALEQTNRLE